MVGPFAPFAVATRCPFGCANLPLQAGYGTLGQIYRCGGCMRTFQSFGQPASVDGHAGQLLDEASSLKLLSGPIEVSGD